MKAPIAALAVALACQASPLRIGVLGLFSPHELSVTGHSLSVAPAGGGQRTEAASPVRLTASGGVVHWAAGSASGEARTLRARASGAVTVAVPGKIAREYQGALEVSARGSVLIPVVVMDSETAVASVVAAESGEGAPMEALKALAIVARSYYRAAKGRHAGFDFCDTTHCQFLRQVPPQGTAAYLAARTTEGRVLSFDGSVVEALFSASCGGHTRTLGEAGMAAGSYPYYSVECEACKHAERWRRVLPVEYAAPLARHTESARLAAGRVLGWSAVPGFNYQVRVENGQTVIEGTGKGHGIGLCQRGASALAHAGQLAEEILSRYFPNTVLR
jgi:stage II sporulation protein D